MKHKIVVISGPIASGKTSLCALLEERFGFKVLKTRDLITTLTPSVRNERVALQKAGDALDKKHRGEWVAIALSKLLDQLPESTHVIVDSVRIVAQVDAIRHAYAGVIHVHITAPTEVLAARFAKRRGAIEDVARYSQTKSNRTEKEVDALRTHADICIDSSRSDGEDVLVRVASHLGLYGDPTARLVDVLVGGQYGSEGKGHVASYLAREYDILVRVGGPNAGHTVYWKESPHKFHQLPSGTLHNPEALLVIGPGAVISLEMLRREIAFFAVAYDRLRIDPNAMIIDPLDLAGEKGTLRDQIGSTAQGVGFATVRKILRTAAEPAVRRAKDIKELSPYVEESLSIFDRAFARGQRIFLEGTQGTGLSIHHGFYPYVTSRETSAAGCLAEAGLCPGRVRRTIMACRTYPIRVQNPPRGTSGPMKGELKWQAVSDRSGVPVEELIAKERTTTTQRRRRVAEFDWALLRKSLSLNSPTDVALTFADYITIANRQAHRFEQLTDETIRLVEEIERVAHAPVSIITTDFNSHSIIDRRKW